MNILFLAPLDNFESKDGGYGNASIGFYSILQVLEKQNKINSVTCLSTNTYENLEDIQKNKYDICFLFTNPTSLLDKRQVSKILPILSLSTRAYLFVFWETMPLPSTWKTIWEMDIFDGFVAPSYFIGSQILKNTKKPVYYIPCYINYDKYTPIAIENKSKEDIFTVLYVGQNTTRKGLKDAIIGFSRVFDQVEDTKLYIKSYSLSNNEDNIEKIIKNTALSNMTTKGTSIYLIDDQLTSDEMVELYKSASVLLFPSRGEGFGLPPVETMALGIPVMYIPWSSLYEVCFSPANITIDYYVDEAYDMFHFGYSHLTSYAVPKIRSIMEGLYKLYYNWKQDRKKYYQNSLINSQLIREKYSKEIVCNCFMNCIEDTKKFVPNDYFNKDLMEYWNKEYEESIKC